MQRDTQASHIEFLVETQVLEAKEVFTKFLNEVAASDLFTVVIESVDVVRASVGECRTETIWKISLNPVMRNRELATGVALISHLLRMSSRDVGRACEGIYVTWWLRP